MSEETEGRPKVVWLTRDQCISRFDFDPTGVPEDRIKSKLLPPRDARGNVRSGHYQRVWEAGAIEQAAQDAKARRRA